MIFFTADTHFNHRNIMDYSSRGFSSIEEMNQFIINRWNETVSKNDTVYHLGDFGFGIKKCPTDTRSLKEIREKLNGRIILVEGNHDGCISKTKWLYHVKIDEYVTHLEFPTFYMQHHPPIIANDKPTVCGHVHQLWKHNKDINAINVGVDVRNYTPVSYEDILNETISMCEVISDFHLDISECSQSNEDAIQMD